MMVKKFLHNSSIMKMQVTFVRFKIQELVIAGKEICYVA